MKHVRKALVALLVLLIALPCIASASTRYTGYASRNTYVYKRASTASTRARIARNTKVYVIGVSGSFYKVQHPKTGVKGYMLKNAVSRTKVPEPAPAPADEDADDGSDSDGTGSEGTASWKSKVVRLDWFKTGKNVLKRGEYGYLYDITTGISMRIKRMGGTNHADVEPATAADTVKLKKIAGGKFSWTCHAVILVAGGRYVACSINTLPHGSQTIKNNNYDGQFCLHMVNSLTHGSKKINVNHQACIQKAYKWAHS